MLTAADIQFHADKIRDDGYTVIERAADPDLVEGLKQALLRTEREHGFGYARTSFEGFKTVASRYPRLTIHNHHREYGFRACAKWRIPE